MKALDKLIAYQSKSARLREFDAGIDLKIRAAIGPGWQFVPAEQESELLSERQRHWRKLRHFHETAIVNSGDLFGHLGLVYEQWEVFAAIGATKTLAAAEALRGLYEQQARLATLEEKDAFWHETRVDRMPIEETAEGLLEFAELLIQYAESHPEDFNPAPTRDPLANFSGIIDALRERAPKNRESAMDSPGLDVAASLINDLREQIVKRQRTNL